MTSKESSQLCRCSIVARCVAFGDACFLEIGLSCMQKKAEAEIKWTIQPMFAL